VPLPDLAERVGFEPTVAINHTAFRERPIEARTGSLWAAEGHPEYESGADRATAGWSGTSNVAAAGAKMATVGADLGTNFSIGGRLRPWSDRPGRVGFPHSAAMDTGGASLGAVAPVRTLANEAMTNTGPLPSLRKVQSWAQPGRERWSVDPSRGRPVICATTSSTASDWSQERPFTSRNVRKATHVVRLFPSTHAWLATRPSASTAAWSIRSDLR